MPEPLECRLDADGMRRQRDRYAALAPHLVSAAREPRRLTVRFDDDVDPDLLQAAVDVERECCPFFEIGLDARTLVFSVAEPEHDPALDAIAEASRGLTAQRSS